MPILFGVYLQKCSAVFICGLKKEQCHQASVSFPNEDECVLHPCLFIANPGLPLPLVCGDKAGIGSHEQAQCSFFSEPVPSIHLSRESCAGCCATRKGFALEMSSHPCCGTLHGKNVVSLSQNHFQMPWMLVHQPFSTRFSERQRSV